MTGPDGRRAFRRFVLDHHPDRGGDHDTFVAGLEALRRQQGAREPVVASVTFYRRPTGVAAVRQWWRSGRGAGSAPIMGPARVNRARSERRPCK